MLPFAGVPLAQTEPLVRRAEEAGWDDLWSGDTNGPDGFTPLALAATWTERMRLGTGVVSAFTREPVPIFVAALRDRMLRLGGEVADGTFVNFLPLSAAGHVVEAIAPPADHDVVCRFFCIPQPAEEGLALARFLFAGYATVPVYEAFFRSLGWGAALDPMVDAWRGGDRKGAVAVAPEELLREIFVFGRPEEMRERLGDYAAAGITTLCLMPICGPEQLPDLLDALAPA
jgi:alkanesulfonate monooxygenase SsuD/methylene tetrahydromethanopterin reductase-like flavin-dependent oxidoreductase (luciferase family)